MKKLISVLLIATLTTSGYCETKKIPWLLTSIACFAGAIVANQYRQKALKTTEFQRTFVDEVFVTENYWSDDWQRKQKNIDRYMRIETVYFRTSPDRRKAHNMKTLEVGLLIGGVVSAFVPFLQVRVNNEGAVISRNWKF